MDFHHINVNDLRLLFSFFSVCGITENQLRMDGPPAAVNVREEAEIYGPPFFDGPTERRLLFSVRRFLTQFLPFPELSIVFKGRRLVY